MVLLLGPALLLAASATQADPPFDPHGDPQSGVLRVTTSPSSRGQCRQCHPSHGDSWTALPKLLFTDNDNSLAFFADGDGPCHRERPSNYPLEENDRLPDSTPYPGYFEANLGGDRRVGVEFRGRWPGELVYTDPSTTSGGHYLSPHAYDMDMPLRGPSGDGLCLNCHDPHGTPNPLDILTASYLGIGGHDAIGAPNEYALCFSCHSSEGPGGMEFENRYLADYYDAGLNGDHAGHQIRMNSNVALAWPPHIQEGDMLPCYDCHNPHGSQGYNGVEPNGFLISDQRPEWSGLTETLTTGAQCRRFCFGCHIPSDGIPGSKTVEGILMNTIPDIGGYHGSASNKSCYDCHGRDYSSATSNNVHNPGNGEQNPWGP